MVYTCLRWSASARAHVHTPLPYLANGWADCVQTWCVASDPLDERLTQVRCGVHLHVRTCTPLSHDGASSPARPSPIKASYWFYVLTRALLGGGAFERPPPLRFFEDSKKTAARSAAGFSPTLPPIFSATFVKISTQCHVRSGHQVRSSDPTTK